jgi:hypothetical protein
MVVQSPPYTALKPTRHPSWSEGKSDRLRGLRTRIRHRQRYSPRRPEHHQQVLQAPAQASGFARHKVARSQAHLRDPALGSRHPPHLCPEVFGTRLGAANPRPLLSLDAEHGPKHRRRDRRGFGLGDLLSPFASSRCRVGAQPQRDMGGLHRLPYHRLQISAQSFEIRLVP